MALFLKTCKLLWLNENATIYDFDSLDDLLTRLTESIEITPEIKALFNSKNAYIFVAAFKAFTELGRKDKEFGEFLDWFVNGGNEVEIDGITWDMLNNSTSYSTRDPGFIHRKLDHLIALMDLYSTDIRKAA